LIAPGTEAVERALTQRLEQQGLLPAQPALDQNPARYRLPPPPDHELHRRPADGKAAFVHPAKSPIPFPCVRCDTFARTMSLPPNSPVPFLVLRCVTFARTMSLPAERGTCDPGIVIRDTGCCRRNRRFAKAQHSMSACGLRCVCGHDIAPLSSVLDNRPFECDATRVHATRCSIEWSAREAGRIYGNETCFSSEAAFRPFQRSDRASKGFHRLSKAFTYTARGGKARSAANSCSICCRLRWLPCHDVSRTNNTASATPVPPRESVRPHSGDRYTLVSCNKSLRNK
jgi:hypothetical protein